MKVYIKTGAVKSGKTQTLNEFYNEKKSQLKFGGFLCEDKIDQENKTRHLKLLGNGQEYQLQLHLTETEFEQQRETIDCINCKNKFVFSKSVFKVAQETLKREFLEEKSADFIIVDEIGPLELKQKAGLEPAFSHVMNNRTSNTKTKLIVVVRESLVKDFRDAYSLQENEVAFFEDLL